MRYGATSIKKRGEGGKGRKRRAAVLSYRSMVFLVCHASASACHTFAPLPVQNDRKCEIFAFVVTAAASKSLFDRLGLDW